MLLNFTKFFTILFLTSVLTLNVHADSQETAHTKMPDPNFLGLVKTLNNMGYMVTKLDVLSKRFVDYMGKTKGKGLDVGTAFGEATIEALKAGAQSMISNDIEPKHIEILEQRIDPELKPKLKTIIADFPEKIDLPENELDGILMARVLHFFDGPKIERSLKAAYKWLKPGGKIFILVSSPYVWQMKEFLPEMAERKKRGDPWPGYTERIWAIAPGMIGLIPPKFHVLDFETMYRALKETGFSLEYYEELSLEEESIANINAKDGKEALAFIAQKPKP